MNGPRTEELEVLVIGAPVSFERRLRSALPEAQVRVAEPYVSRCGPDALAVVYCREVLDRRVVTRLAGVLPTVVVSERVVAADAVMSLESGAEGYLDAAISETALANALLGVARGELAYARAIFGLWLRTRHPRPRSRVTLTPRQRQIIELIATGASDKEIGAAIGVRGATVQKHVARLLKRLGVRNRAAAVAIRSHPSTRHEAVGTPR